MLFIFLINFSRATWRFLPSSISYLTPFCLYNNNIIIMFQLTFLFLLLDSWCSFTIFGYGYFFFYDTFFRLKNLTQFLLRYSLILDFWGTHIDGFFSFFIFLALDILLGLIALIYFDFGVLWLVEMHTRIFFSS